MEKKRIFIIQWFKNISEIIQNTQIDNLDIITSNVDLSGLEVETAGDSGRALYFKGQTVLILKAKQFEL